MAGKPWIKLYERWMTSPRHRGLGGDTLGTGALWLLMAEALGEDGQAGERWLLGPDRAPARLDTVHRLADVRPRAGRLRASRLLEVGTMVERDDGCLGFANYRQWQENPAAARMRKHRGAENRSVTSDVTCDREAEVDTEAEVEEEKSVTPAKRTVTKRPPSPEACESAQYLYDAIRSHSPEFMSNAPPAEIARKLTGWAKAIDVGMRRDGMTLEGCKRAIDAAHRGADDFWHSNLLSGAKLRKHYERLRMRKTSKTNGHNAGVEQMAGFDYHAFGEELDRQCGIKK